MSTPMDRSQDDSHAEGRGRHREGAGPDGAAQGATAVRGDDREERLPEPPPKPGAKRHLLGILVGLLLTPVGLILATVGAERISDAMGLGTGQAQTSAPDWLGITLVVLGTLILAAIVLLSTWSPALPITGGLVWALTPAVVVLSAPWLLTDLIEALPGGVEVNPSGASMDWSIVVSFLLVVGALLVAAGVAAAQARRKGRRWAEQRAEALGARGARRRTAS